MKETEKESLYNKALERAKQLLNTSVAYDRFTIESIFPELKESEDERIRKTLIEFFGKGAEYNSSTNGISDKDILAWLKKQEEIKIPKWIFDFLEECRPYIGCALGYDERRDIEGKVVAVQKWLEKQGEQKPADKVEPKFKVGDLVKDTNHHRKPIYKIVHIDKECYICESDDVTLGDKAIMHFAFDNPYLRLVEQKPAWSEEDETKLRQVEYACMKFFGGDCSHVGWLRKSLKERFTWKPSEEQMNALETAISSLQSTTLESLYNELKKL